MFRRSNQIAVLSSFLVLCMSAPALAQGVYEGTGTLLEEPDDFSQRNVQIRVAGVAPNLSITLKTVAQSVTQFFGRGITYEVTLSGTAYSGTMPGFARNTITGQITCEGTITGVAIFQGVPVTTITFEAECVSGCEFLRGLPPDCGGEEEEEEEEDEKSDCPTVSTELLSVRKFFTDGGLWARDVAPGPNERALVKNGPHQISFTSEITNAALFAKDSAHLFRLGFFTYTLTEFVSDCAPSFKVGNVDSGFVEFKNGIVEAHALEIGGPTRLDGAVLRSQSLARIGVAGGSNGSLTFDNDAGFVGVNVVVGSDADGKVDILFGSMCIDDVSGELIVGSRAVGELSVFGRGRVDLSLPGVDLIIAEVSEASGSRVDILGGELFQRATIEDESGQTFIGRGPDAKGSLSVLAQGKASLGNIILGLEAFAEGTLTVGVESELKALSIVVGDEGRGTMEVSSESKVETDDIFLATGDDSRGELRIVGNGTDDAKTRIDVENLFIGKGQATLSIKSGARLEVRILSSVAGISGSSSEVTATVEGKFSLWKTGGVLVGPNAFLLITKEGRMESTTVGLLGDLNLDAQADVTEGGTWSVSKTLEVGAKDQNAFLFVDNKSFLNCPEVIIGEEGIAEVRSVVLVAGTNTPVGNFKGLQRAQAANEPVPGLTAQRLIIEEGGQLIAETITLGPGGELGGSGAVNLDIISKGTIDPGGEEGETDEFTINGDLTLEGDSEVQVDIGGLIPGEEYDVLIVNGHCRLGGRLKINLVNGYLPNVGDRFEVLKYESREGEYDTIDSDGTGVYFTPELANGRLTLIAAVVDESGRLSPEELADLALMQGACAPGCGPMGLMPLGLTLLGICG